MGLQTTEELATGEIQKIMGLHQRIIKCITNRTKSMTFHIKTKHRGLVMAEHYRKVNTLEYTILNSLKHTKIREIQPSSLTVS